MGNKCKCIQTIEEPTEIIITKSQRSNDIRKQLISERKLLNQRRHNTETIYQSTNNCCQKSSKFSNINDIQGQICYFQSFKSYKEYNSVQNSHQKFEQSQSLQQQNIEKKKLETNLLYDGDWERLEMDLVNKFGKMGLVIQGNGKTIKPMVMAYSIMLMEIFMKGFGRKIKLKDMEYICIKTDQDMKEIGIKICIMEQALKHGQMVVNTKESIQKGMKNGQGIYKWADGSIYDGQWENNKMNGFGKQTWADGRYYEGQWKNDMMHGNGTQIWPDGRKYEGNYEYDKKNGFGIMEWSNGKKYEGYWLNGKQHGEGKLINANQETIICQWKNGQRL